jgi:hypothetical protein
MTAQVTHQYQGLQPYLFVFSLCGPCPVSRDPENLRFQAVSKSCLSGLMVISQPLVAHGVGGQDVDEFKSGWNG